MYACKNIEMDHICIRLTQVNRLDIKQKFTDLLTMRLRLLNRFLLS